MSWILGLNTGDSTFQPRVMHSRATLPTADQQQLFAGLQIRLLTPEEWPRGHQLLKTHHCLASGQPVGERLFYAVTDAWRDWLGVLVFCVAARRLSPRDQQDLAAFARASPSVSAGPWHPPELRHWTISRAQPAHLLPPLRLGGRARSRAGRARFSMPDARRAAA